MVRLRRAVCTYRDKMAGEALVFKLVQHQVDNRQELTAKYGLVLRHRAFANYASNMGLIGVAVDACHLPLRCLFKWQMMKSIGMGTVPDVHGRSVFWIRARRPTPQGRGVSF